MPIQIGDIIAIARLALEVYEYGWSENRRAGTYTVFFLSTVGL